MYCSVLDDCMLLMSLFCIQYLFEHLFSIQERFRFFWLCYVGNEIRDLIKLVWERYEIVHLAICWSPLGPLCIARDHQILLTLVWTWFIQYCTGSGFQGIIHSPLCLIIQLIWIKFFAVLTAGLHLSMQNYALDLILKKNLKKNDRVRDWLEDSLRHIVTWDDEKNALIPPSPAKLKLITLTDGSYFGSDLE